MASNQGFFLEKTREKTGLGFTSAFWIYFDDVATVGAGVALTVVQARLPIGSRLAVAKVTLMWTAITGAATFNIVYGSGTAGAVAYNNTSYDYYNPTLAVLNASLFATAPTLSTAVSGSQAVQDFYPDNLGAVYDTPGLFTLRVTTVASTGALAHVKGGLMVQLVDPQPQQTNTFWAFPGANFNTPTY